MGAPRLLHSPARFHFKRFGVALSCSSDIIITFHHPVAPVDNGPPGVPANNPLPVNGPPGVPANNPLPVNGPIWSTSKQSTSGHQSNLGCQQTIHFRSTANPEYLANNSLPVNGQPGVPANNLLPVLGQPGVPTNNPLPVNGEPGVPVNNPLPVNGQPGVPANNSLPVNGQPRVPTNNPLPVNGPPRSASEQSTSGQRPTWGASEQSTSGPNGQPGVPTNNPLPVAVLNNALQNQTKIPDDRPSGSMNGQASQGNANVAAAAPDVAHTGKPATCPASGGPWSRG